MEDPSVLPREAVAVAREVAQPLQLDWRSITRRQPPSGQELGDVECIFAVGLEAPASQRASLRGIGQHQLIDDRLEHLPKPAIKSYTLNGYRMRPWQGCEVLRNLPAAPAGNFLERYFSAAAAENARGERVLVQVHTNTPAMVERHHKFLHVRGRKQQQQRRSITASPGPYMVSASALC